MSAGNAARHRAARRPVTPLTEIAQTVGSGAGKRAAVVATAGGLIISTLGASTAQAAPAPNDAATKLSTVELGALTNQARAALAAAPAVTVAADAQVEVEVVSAEAETAVQVTPAPRPRVVQQRATTTASRTADRTEAAPTIGAAVPDFANGSAVVSVAMRYVGVPYVSGGTTPDGFDCSGFTQYVYAQVGINLPRSSGAQRSVGTVVSRADAQPGDLIWSPGHVAIYAGNGMQLDAPRPGKTIQLRSIWQSSPTFIRLG
ncbi:NLP/P60 protein [Xylanimonas cellulosilytica DSM 15894]|uniref:NLP/P60 protein n=1 Tax=Xylanimonas cellulosilytica (strain DSM 15894 / JCM 12276 / CECT 5975 / KCTC 9989 / LMG 20990 / NBRC 107835 / XIL07) TaxID=446471 RepID=D1BYI6_XYLCX|nr:C40 family peptidase [Xylanimonas cellulosilytica]ACZ31858.1 NLP/P60 protein [Xylanimonas cellulosilytica DSM 15894]